MTVVPGTSTAVLPHRGARVTMYTCVLLHVKEGGGGGAVSQHSLGIVYTMVVYTGVAHYWNENLNLNRTCSCLLCLIAVEFLC